MPRNITPAMLTAISSPSFQPAIFAQIQFATSTQYVWTGIGSITWNSQVWTGLGSLLGVGQQIADTSNVEARGIAIELSGLDPTLTPAAMGEVQLGLPVTTWLAAMVGGAPVADPVILFSGAMDQPTVEIGADTASISLAVENLLASMDVPVDRRYTPQDQQMDWPGDLGLMFVYQIMETSIFWGFPTTTGNV